MLTGELRSQIDSIWNAFWSGGISNPLEVMEQITYLLFLRRLDDLHTLEENKSVRLNKPMERSVFPEGLDAKGRDYNDLRWSRFKNFAPAEMYTVIGEHVFPFLRTMGGDGYLCTSHEGCPFYDTYTGFIVQGSGLTSPHTDGRPRHQG